MIQISPGQVFTDIVGILDTIMGDWEHSEEITLETGLYRDLGLESIDGAVLGGAIEELYQRNLPFAQFLSEMNQRGAQDLLVGDLVDFLYRQLHSASGSEEGP
jgi:acyl carrier protein